ncbi:hypothetical protein FRC19_010450 [Serendipita sp. 401]|nr:hypothetical protein FRC19_010450 [Serendipita sp. 401]KAG9052737.1 hypothetical protein FS842_009331 [Serendipita sp. 407]
MDPEEVKRLFRAYIWRGSPPRPGLPQFYTVPPQYQHLTIPYDECPICFIVLQETCTVSPIRQGKVRPFQICAFNRHQFSFNLNRTPQQLAAPATAPQPPPLLPPQLAPVGDFTPATSPQKTICSLDNCSIKTSAKCQTGFCAQHCTAEILSRGGGPAQCPQHSRQIEKERNIRGSSKTPANVPPAYSTRSRSAEPMSTPTSNPSRAMPMALPVNSRGINIFDSNNSTLHAVKATKSKGKDREYTGGEMDEDQRKRELTVRIWRKGHPCEDLTIYKATTTTAFIQPSSFPSIFRRFSQGNGITMDDEIKVFSWRRGHWTIINPTSQVPLDGRDIVLLRDLKISTEECEGLDGFMASFNEERLPAFPSPSVASTSGAHSSSPSPSKLVPNLTRTIIPATSHTQRRYHGKAGKFSWWMDLPASSVVKLLRDFRRLTDTEKEESAWRTAFGLQSNLPKEGREFKHSTVWGHEQQLLHAGNNADPWLEANQDRSWGQFRAAFPLSSPERHTSNGGPTPIDPAIKEEPKALLKIDMKPSSDKSQLAKAEPAEAVKLEDITGVKEEVVMEYQSQTSSVPIDDATISLSSSSSSDEVDRMLSQPKRKSQRHSNSVIVISDDEIIDLTLTSVFG